MSYLEYLEKYGMFLETLKLLHMMHVKGLVDKVTCPKLNAELYMFEHYPESCHEKNLLKFLYILCENVPYKDELREKHLYYDYIEENKKRLEEDSYFCICMHNGYLKRKEEYDLPENVEKRRLEREEREKKEAKLHDRLRPRIMKDMMIKSEGGIIFSDIQ
jgi:hypothetical protein